MVINKARREKKKNHSGRPREWTELSSPTCSSDPLELSKPQRPELVTGFQDVGSLRKKLFT